MYTRFSWILKRRNQKKKGAAIRKTENIQKNWNEILRIEKNWKATSTSNILHVFCKVGKIRIFFLQVMVSLVHFPNVFIASDVALVIVMLKIKIKSKFYSLWEEKKKWKLTVWNIWICSKLTDFKKHIILEVLESNNYMQLIEFGFEES